MLIFRTISECVSRRYRKSTSGIEAYRDNVDNLEEFKSVISKVEDIFWHDNGTATNGAGNEVYNPKYPAEFDFGDYTYILKKLFNNNFTDAELKAIDLDF